MFYLGTISSIIKKAIKSFKFVRITGTYQTSKSKVFKQKYSSEFESDMELANKIIETNKNMFRKLGQ